MSHPDIIIDGKRIGRFRASRLLFSEAFRFFRADKEMILLPIVGFSVLCMFIAIVALTLNYYTPGYFEALPEGDGSSRPYGYVLVFMIYIAAAFAVSWMQAAIVHIVSVRAHGGDASFSDGVRVACSHWSALLLWSFITSTVGIILRMIAERSQILGRILVGLLGAVWSVVTYFVVPSLVLGKRSAFDALYDSKDVFTRTWGETFVINVSFSIVLVFGFLLYVCVLVGLLIAFGGNLAFTVVFPIFLVLGIIGFVLMSAVLDGVLRTLLYLYASEGIVPTNFNRELLDQILIRKSTIQTPPQVGGGIT